MAYRRKAWLPIVLLSLSCQADRTLDTPDGMSHVPVCWDYNKDDKVELFGRACDDVQAAANVKVQIVVGCDTVIG